MYVDHAAVIFTHVMDLKFTENVQWKKNPVPNFFAYYKTVSEASIEKCRVTLKHMMKVSGEEEEDSSMELSSYTFMLMYGTKILLLNIKMRLIHGKIAFWAGTPPGRPP